MIFDTICDECDAKYKIKHDMDDNYIPRYCPFCGADIPVNLGAYLQGEDGFNDEEWED